MSRVVIHVDTAAGWRGGQNQVLLTARGMNGRGELAAIACRKGSVLEARARAAEVAVAPMPFRGDLWPPGILALARLLRREPGAVLLLHDPHAVSAGLIASRIAGAAPPLAVRRVDFPLKGRLSLAKYRACRRVLAVSRAILGVLESAGVERERLRLVYEGVPEPARVSGGREALASLGVPQHAQVIGNVAALTGHKDHATLLEAMALVRARKPDARLVICGEGELRGALEARARALGIADRVLFAGFRRDLDRLMPAFDVFCLSSHLEGLGTSLLDAMALGLPVVATAAGGIPEAVEDGATGRLVAPRDARALADALAEALGDERQLAAWGEAGRRRYLERFTAERMVDETLRVIEEAA
jgi:glycosyltransferase involved in cell wall biosynthesis